MNDAPLLELRGVARARNEAGLCNQVSDLSLTIAVGDIVALTGEEGCGKNLVLRLLGLLEPPDTGEVFFDGQPTSGLTDDARIELRSRRCGYVLSAPFLLAAFNAAENVAMPIFKISQLTPEQARDRTEALLRFVGLDDVACQKTLPPALQYRVALARALANNPTVLFVENLDQLLAADDLPDFRRLLHAAARELSVAVVLTASPALTPVDGERRFEIADGRIICEVQP
jgi:lipoprotein-releasing system ATP-binding protein